MHISFSPNESEQGGYMGTLKGIGILFLVILLSESVRAQSSAAFQWLSLPRSISSQGLGEEGVASRNPVDAMEYNPANLTAADGIDLSFFRNPWNILDFPFPISSLCAAAKLGDAGYGRVRIHRSGFWRDNVYDS